MSEAAAKYMQNQHRKAKKPSSGPPLNASERAALRKLREEARLNGVTLSNGGKGGLPPSLVLGVMRRDEWTCKVHGDRGEGENGGLQVHHKGGLENPNSAWLKAKGKSNDPNNIVTLCARAHDEVHDRDRAEGAQ
jgi:5-methylcytosine-specific restriction endonuclease McrA